MIIILNLDNVLKSMNKPLQLNAHQRFDIIKQNEEVQFLIDIDIQKLLLNKNGSFRNELVELNENMVAAINKSLHSNLIGKNTYCYHFRANYKKLLYQSNNSNAEFYDGYLL